MKNLLLIFSSAILLMFTACNECKNVPCLNSGICEDGKCDCPDGYSGEACEIEDKCITSSVSCDNDKECVDGFCECGDWYEGESCSIKLVNAFIGPYQGSFNCASVNGIVTLASVSDGDNILILKEYTGREYEGIFITDSSFEIPNQVLPEEYGYGALEVSGSGSISSLGKLSYSVTYNYPSQGSSTTCVYSGM